MKVTKNSIVYFMAILLSGAIVSSCATSHVNLVADGKVIVEKVSSRSAYFPKIAVYSTDSKMTVSGELHKRKPGRGHIFGHVDIEVVSPNETVLCTINTDYHRRSLKSFTSIFSVDIPLRVEDGSTVRVIHHRDSKVEKGKVCMANW